MEIVTTGHAFIYRSAAASGGLVDYAILGGLPCIGQSSTPIGMVPRHGPSLSEVYVYERNDENYLEIGYCEDRSKLKV